MEKGLISKDGVKTFFRQSNLRVSKELYDALDTELRSQLAKVAKRAMGNKRSTILPFDL